MRRGEALLSPVVDALAIQSITRWTWYRKATTRLPRAVERALTYRDARAVLLERIKQHLYSNFYMTGGASRGQSDFAGLATSDGALEELIASELGTAFSWSPGWRIVSRDADAVLVQRGNLRVAASRHGIRQTAGSDTDAAVRFPALARQLSPGFVLVRGERDLDADAPVLRIYWNLTEPGIRIFVRAVADAIGRADVPYRFKISRYLAANARNDAAVLYVRASDWPTLSSAIAHMETRVRAHLHPGTPALTHTLAPGVALAEDPADGASFGQVRCGYIAEGLVRAFETGMRTPGDRLRVLVLTMDESGCDVERPHLNRGSSAVYPFEVASKPVTVSSAAAPITEPLAQSGLSYLDVAARIGDAIAADARWSGARCTWTAAQPGSASVHNTTRTNFVATLSPDLYSGSGGIALFLGELAAAAGGNAAIERTARGAMDHTFDLVDRPGARNSYGLFTGTLGVALAGARLAVLSSDRQRLDGAAALGRSAAAGILAADSFDVLNGTAGGVLGVLALAEVSRRADLTDLARMLGDRLVEQVSPMRRGVAWRDAQSRNLALTGYSHGASGAAHALLELYAKTDEAKYRDVAVAAFDYERSCLDARAGNWPDFRLERGEPRPRRSEYSCLTLWCHGAPGILLARIRAAALLGDSSLINEAAIAAQTTRAWLDDHRVGPSLTSYCLCHGMAGNCWALAEYAKATGDAAASTTVSAVATAGIEAHAAAGSWPSGVGEGVTPSFMLGHAGTGAFYLRLARPELVWPFYLHFG